jgi:phosphoadenosine phosphosulfate reductase
MALIDYTLNGKVNKVEIAIKRIKEYSDFAVQLTGKPYHVAYSGGKDSDAVRILCALADVPHELVHNLTTADAPDTVYYIRSIPGMKILHPDISMWDLIVKKGLPPLRNMRYCCFDLKEYSGKDRFVMTGVRWEESGARRNTRNSFEILSGNKAKKIILNADNDENRRLFETCTMQGKRLLNPIIDWTTAEVWEFLDYYSCKSNPLYERHYHRIGCLGCPLAAKARLREFIDYPKYKELYIKTFDRMLKRRIEREKPTLWKSGEEVFAWWISGKRDSRKDDGQLTLLDYDD